MTKRKPARAKKPAKPDDRLAHELEIHKIELHIQNEELRESRVATEAALERYREVFDFAPIGYAVLSDGDMITEINHHGAELLGGAQAMFVRKRFGAFVANESVSSFRAIVRSALTQRGLASGEVELLRNSMFIPVRLHAAALQRERPTMLVAFEDISERKAKDIELARTAHSLREEARRKDEFLAMLSHELRNPLAPIRTSVAVLDLLELPGSNAREAVDIIRSSSDHMARLVDDLLDITRITRSKIVLQRQPVDLCEVARRVIAEHGGEAATYGLAFEQQICAEPVWIDGDPARLVQIFSNLFGNAEKFTPSGGRITVSVARADSQALVQVSDTGIGISRDIIARLGQPFVQAPQALDRSPGGLGLGLATVRSLVELHGGTFRIHSAGIGRGAEIALTFPVIESPQARRLTPAAARPPPRHVLVIEDNQEVARSLVQLLKLRGHIVDVAYDGESGIARALEVLPEVVLCDVGLPDVDGYEVARRLRSESKANGISLVALSGYARPEDSRRALDAGFDGHLAKPAGVQALDRVLRSPPHRRQ